jgi:hypothetical protein
MPYVLRFALLQSEYRAQDQRRPRRGHEISYGPLSPSSCCVHRAVSSVPVSSTRLLRLPCASIAMSVETNNEPVSIPIPIKPSHIILKIIMPDLELALRIPLKTITRLTLYPLPWFCYIGFAITAAKGTLKKYQLRSRDVVVNQEQEDEVAVEDMTDEAEDEAEDEVQDEDEDEGQDENESQDENKGHDKGQEQEQAQEEEQEEEEQEEEVQEVVKEEDYRSMSPDDLTAETGYVYVLSNGTSW